ncbi:MAG: hypothetical protein ABJN69_09900 [Hellea sp.]
MTRPKKLICSVIATGLLVNLISLKAHADTAPNLTVYAGPQSVSPREVIHVTVELTEETSSRMNDEAVELSYMSDGTSKTVSGTLKFGLVSFEVPGQDKTGLMTFTAKAADVTSKEALVTVVAGSPMPFKITVQPNKKPETVKLSSGPIMDRHDNPISDLSLVSLEWIDVNGLKARQSVQPLNGRISLRAKCPANFTAPLRVRAVIDAVESISKDVSADCVARQG